jgi:hypothetical protein
MKSYVTLSNLKQHEQVHIGKDEREKFECPVPQCKKSFYHKCSLNKHVQRVHVGFHFDVNAPLKKVKISRKSHSATKKSSSKGIYSLYS